MYQHHELGYSHGHCAINCSSPSASEQDEKGEKKNRAFMSSSQNDQSLPPQIILEILTNDRLTHNLGNAILLNDE